METSCGGVFTPYTLTESQQATDEDLRYTAYGIDLCDPKGDLTERLQDVSCNRDMVNKMVELFNLCGLPSERFKTTVLSLLP